MIHGNFKLDLDLFLSNGHLHAETILITTEYVSGANMLVHQKVGETTQALANALLKTTLNANTGVRNEYFFNKKTYGADKPKHISKNAFLERMGTFEQDETHISQETLLKYRYNDKHGRDNIVNIVVNRSKNCKPTAYIEFANMNEYRNFCPPVWLTVLVE